MRVLALDVGSSSVKAGYWDGRRFLARSRATFKTQFDGVRVEVPPDELLAALVRAAREAVGGLGRRRKVDAVGYCAFSSGLVVTDARGNTRRPIITHQDRRSIAEAAALAARRGKRWWLARTGNLPYPGGIAASSLAWLRAHEPRTLTGDIRVGQLSSLIGRFLTGDWVIDPSNAVFLGLLNVRTLRWESAACDAVGIRPGTLPRLAWADEAWGTLTAEAARVLGIPEGTPVGGGFIDTSAAVVQTPMTAGQLVHNAGSTDVLAMSLPGPACVEGVLSRPVGVGRPGGPFARRALWLAVRTMGAAGSAVAWLRRECFPDVSDRRWTRIVAHACDAHTAVTCVPTFAGERVALAGRRGAAFDGITLAATRDDLLAAIIRGLVDASAENMRILSALHPAGKNVYVMGGGSAIAEAMHRAWKNSARRSFQRLTGEGLRGVVATIEAALA
jgi:sugar (pentulose or hexulose) kinase